jgi:hypothetical protein
MALAFTLPARAETAADRETARTLMDDGMARRERNDHRGALERFEAADALMHVPTTGIEVARERMGMGMLIEAREALAGVLRYPEKPGEPAPFTEARAEAQKFDLELAARIPSIRIVVQGAAGRATVSVDTIDVPQATLIVPRKLNPGSHTVLARAGGRERHLFVSLREQEHRELVLDLAAPQTAETPSRKHASKVPAILTYAGFGTAAAFTIAGTVAGIRSITAANAAKGGCASNECPPPTYSDIDTARTAGNLATAAFIVAGAGAAVGIVGILLNRGEPPAENARLSSAFVF